MSIRAETKRQLLIHDAAENAAAISKNRHDHENLEIPDFLRQIAHMANQVLRENIYPMTREDKLAANLLRNQLIAHGALPLKTEGTFVVTSNPNEEVYTEAIHTLAFEDTKGNQSHVFAVHRTSNRDEHGHYWGKIVAAKRSIHNINELSYNYGTSYTGEDTDNILLKLLSQNRLPTATIDCLDASMPPNIFKELDGLLSK